MSITNEDCQILIDTMDETIKNILLNELQLDKIMEAIDNEQRLTSSFEDMCGMCNAYSFYKAMGFILDKKKKENKTDKILDDKIKNFENFENIFITTLSAYNITPKDLDEFKPKLDEHRKEKKLQSKEEFKAWNHPDTQKMLKDYVKIIKKEFGVIFFDHDLNIKEIV
jgi:hypothetical protein